MGEEAGDTRHPDPGGARRRRPGPLRGVPGLVTRRRRAGLRPAAVSLRAAERRQGPGRPSGSPGAGGLVDCSIGTPCDPPPAGRAGGHGHLGHRARLSDLAGLARPTAGRRPDGWQRRFGVAVDPDRRGGRLRGHQGVRGHDRPVPAPAHARTGTPSSTRRCPTRPTPWGPRWPGSGPCRCPSWPAAGLDLDAVDPARRRPGPAAVGQLAGQPDRAPDRPGPGGGLGTGARGARLLRRVLRRVHLGRPAPDRSSSRGATGVVAVHSLSKRSNLAGVRAGFYAGDPDLVDLPPRRAAPRRADGAGPGPGRRGGRPRRRRPRRRAAGPRTSTGWTFLADALAAGRACRSACRPGGFYLWVPVPRARSPTDGSCATGWPTEAGLLVSPGELYGPDGSGPRAGGGGPAPGPARAGGRAPRRRRLTGRRPRPPWPGGRDPTGAGR